MLRAFAVKRWGFRQSTTGTGRFKQVGGFNPFEKYARQIGSFPQGSGWKWKRVKPPPRYTWKAIVVINSGSTLPPQLPFEKMGLSYVCGFQVRTIIKYSLPETSKFPPQEMASENFKQVSQPSTLLSRSVFQGFFAWKNCTTFAFFDPPGIQSMPSSVASSAYIPKNEHVP